MSRQNTQNSMSNAIKQHPNTALRELENKIKYYPNNSKILVEGTTDSKVLEQLTSRQFCNIIPLGNKDNVLAAANSYSNQANDIGLLAVYDEDYDFFLNKNHETNNIFSTKSATDIEILILKYDKNITSKLIRYFLNQEQIDNFNNTYHISIQKFILEITSKIGILRVISESRPCRLKINETVFDDCLDDNFQFDFQHYMQKLNNNRPYPLSPRIITSILNQINNTIHTAVEEDLWKYRKGHDFSKVCNMVFQKLGTKIRCSKIEIENFLYWYYESNDFKVSDLYYKLKKWESSHNQYTIFR